MNKILVVDDSKAMRMIVKRSLGQAGLSGAEILEAENGAEALAAVDVFSPDLVLSDWNMPEMNGYQLLQALRAQGNAVTFGFVTSESTDAMRAQASEAGAAFLIAKPFGADDFTKALATLV